MQAPGQAIAAVNLSAAPQAGIFHAFSAPNKTPWEAFERLDIKLEKA